MRYLSSLVVLLALAATSWACPPTVAFTSGACYATQQVQMQTVAYAVPTVSYALVVPQVQQIQVQAAYAAPALLPAASYGSAAIGYSSAGVVGGYGVGVVGYGAGFNAVGGYGSSGVVVRQRAIFRGGFFGRASTLPVGFGGVNVAVGGGFFGGVHRGLFGGGGRAVVRVRAR